jgi:hypothetical protein
MPSQQKLGLIRIENKVFLTKKLSPKLIFLELKKPFDIKINFESTILAHFKDLALGKEDQMQ